MRQTSNVHISKTRQDIKIYQSTYLESVANFRCGFEKLQIIDSDDSIFS